MTAATAPPVAQHIRDGCQPGACWDALILDMQLRLVVASAAPGLLLLLLLGPAVCSSTCMNSNSSTLGSLHTPDLIIAKELCPRGAVLWLWCRCVVAGVGDPLAAPTHWEYLTQAFLAAHPRATFLHASQSYARLLAGQGYLVNELGRETVIQVGYFRVTPIQIEWAGLAWKALRQEGGTLSHA